jgi:hypothetical protein
MHRERRSVLGPRGVVLLVMLLVTMTTWIAFQRWDANRGRREPAPVEPLRGAVASLPSGAIVVGELDLLALRAHPVTRDWLREPRTVEGLGNIGALCGSDPLERVEKVAFAVPSVADLGFGLVAIGAPQPDAATCAERVIERRGGTVARESTEAFSLVRDGRAPSGATLAVDPRGRLLLGERAYLTEIMKVASGGAPSVADDPLHERFRKAVGPGALVLSVVLTEDLRLSLGDELRKQGIAGSPFGALRGGAIAIALDQQLSLRGVLVTDDVAAAVGMSEALRVQLAAQSETTLARLVGYAPLLQRLEVAVQGTDVTLRAELRVEEFLAVLRRIVTLQRLAGQASREGAPAAGPSSPRPSDAPSAPPN